MIKKYKYKGKIKMKVCKDKCVACGSCVGACPVNAIDFVDGVAFIDKDKCIECGTCEAICPVEAINSDEQ